MDLKKVLGNVAKDKLLGGAANKILPMDDEPKKMGWKAKLAGVLATVAAIAAAGSQLLGG